MSSGIEVYFTKMNKPWSNADPSLRYRVNVYGPDGTEYVGIPAPNGHASIDLPPGTYMVTGNAYDYIYRNFDSNETLVHVCCDKRPCVTVIPRSLHSCVWWLIVAVQTITQVPDIAPKVAPLARQLGKTLAEFEAAIPAEFRMPAYLQKEKVLEQPKGGGGAGGGGVVVGKAKSGTKKSKK